MSTISSSKTNKKRRITPFFVPERGLEPPPLARFDFESNAATITPLGQVF